MTRKRPPAFPREPEIPRRSSPVIVRQAGETALPPVGDLEQVEAHAWSCPPCTDRLQSVRETDERLGELLREGVDDGPCPTPEELMEWLSAPTPEGLTEHLAACGDCRDDMLAAKSDVQAFLAAVDDYLRCVEAEEKAAIEAAADMDAEALRERDVTLNRKFDAANEEKALVGEQFNQQVRAYNEKRKQPQE